jgi:hypothetical protein
MTAILPDVAEIRGLLNHGETVDGIARRYRVQPDTVVRKLQRAARGIGPTGHATAPCGLCGHTAPVDRGGIRCRCGGRQ